MRLRDKATIITARVEDKDRPPHCCLARKAQKSSRAAVRGLFLEPEERGPTRSPHAERFSPTWIASEAGLNYPLAPEGRSRQASRR